MEVLAALGVDGTVIHQGLIFLITYIFMYFLLFKPYSLAHIERVKRTGGAEEEADLFLEESQKLEEEYQKKAREVNEQYKQVFDEARIKTTKECDELLKTARTQAKTVYEDAKSQLHQQFEQARKDVEGQVPELSKMISEKLLNRNLEI